MLLSKIEFGVANKKIISLLFVILMFPAISRAALSPNILADQYLLTAKKYIAAKKYHKALDYFERSMKLNIDPEDEFYFYFGKALLNTRDYRKCKENLTKYLASVTPKGSHYKDALELLTKAEERLDKNLKPVKGYEKKAPKNYSERFVRRTNKVVYDRETNLEWYVAPDKDITWKEAEEWTERLFVDGGGWRMPTRDELSKLYNKDAWNGECYITPLLKTSECLVWSSETKGSSSAWAFYFTEGYPFWYARRYDFFKRGFAVRSHGD